jgi:hypothetical protein
MTAVFLLVRQYHTSQAVDRYYIVWAMLLFVVSVLFLFLELGVSFEDLVLSNNIGEYLNSDILVMFLLCFMVIYLFLYDVISLGRK